MLFDEDEYLAHYGMLRRSGRYPWGTGGTPLQNHRSFLAMVDAMKAEGLKDDEIAKGFGEDIKLSRNDFVALRTVAAAEVKAANSVQAVRLRESGMSWQAIADEMGLAGESSARDLVKPNSDAKAKQMNAAADMIRDQLKDGSYLDVGVGNELYVGMSRTQFDAVLSIVRNEGYRIEKVQEDQVGRIGKTTLKVLVPENVTYSDIVRNKDNIKSFSVRMKDDEIIPVRPPVMFDSKRLKVNYKEDGGEKADGLMYIRPGAKDLDMGGAHYSQVRIAVDGTHFIKGVAVYKEGLPHGTDIVFNTNKSDTGNKLDALKPLKKLPQLDKDGKPVLDDKGKPVMTDKVDMENPFGSVIKPGGQRGALNILYEEGDWGTWSKSLPAQMLAKQNKVVAKEQLKKFENQKREELNEILALTNPAVRKKLLQSYSDDVDSAAVDMQGAAMDRQATQVLIPVPKLRDTEVYAPNFRNGERVALVRFPHGGTFEIPELVVNNKHKESRELLGTQPKDAIGINAKVAERLSGADFDGDTVLVIPNDHGKIKSSPSLAGLKDFNPKRSFPAYEGMPEMTTQQKQMEMGKATNLVTDMTIKGATNAEIASAVRHTMVVIDAEKHHLNYKQSYVENGIANLQKKYQSKPDSIGLGASTLISRSTAEKHVDQRKFGYKIDPATGEKIFIKTGDSWVDKKTGKLVVAKTKSTQGAEAKDAHTLSSGTPIEEIYANHSNRMKAMANEARKALVSTPSTPYSNTARQVYKPEYQSLKAKLNIALKNAPRERQAQVVANAIIRQKKDANPTMSSEDLKKVKARALYVARARTSAKKDLVEITPSEWDAIQAGAVSTNELSKILNNTDLKRVKELATPRSNPVMTAQRMTKARSLLASGRTPAEVAQILGVPVSTIRSSLEE